jgi:undecaprenyl-diphosphatase
MKQRGGPGRGPLEILARPDARLLISALVLAGCAWAFFAMSDLVTHARTQHLDDKLMRMLREPGDLAHPVGPSWLPGTMRDLTALGSPPVVAFFVLAAAGAFAARRQHHALALLIVATAGGALLNLLLKETFARPRPELALRLTDVSSTSFPSGHAMDSAVIYLTLAALLAKLLSSRALKIYFLLLALILTLIIGVTRVYLGVHYPSDVLAGWIAGLAWALLCWTVAGILQGQGAVEPPG